MSHSPLLRVEIERLAERLIAVADRPLLRIGDGGAAIDGDDIVPRAFIRNEKRYTAFVVAA